MTKADLTEADFVAAAKAIGCDVPAVKAVAEVEAPLGGFLPDGRPRILFEGHHFSAFTNHQYDKKYPSISYPKWDQKKYKGPLGEWKRYEQAAKLDGVAAAKSASWGKFQIMGFNWKLTGHASLTSFLMAMNHSEGEQLKAFVKIIDSFGLEDEMRERRWLAFARIYNGAGYYKNKYDLKLSVAYERIAMEMM